ncbi:hypothetical protein L195_g028544, partial [Trifolium pratense]
SAIPRTSANNLTPIGYGEAFAIEGIDDISSVKLDYDVAEEVLFHNELLL